MKLIKNIFYLFFPLLIGGIVSLLINNNIDYNTLVKPPFSPPSILFPIAWTIIYILIGISYFIYRKDNNDKTYKIIYYLQLFVNAFWSIIFFLWKLRGLAVFWIILLDVLVIVLYFLAKRDKSYSRYFLIPYIVWILFATYLTIGIYFLN